MDAAPPQTQPSIHTPLDPATRQIRLLQILDGDASSRICCTLETYDVAATSYIALSYTWGSEEDSQIVCINGVEFRVRKNLFDYLLVARRCLEKPLLWIDQICIDQGNVRERNHQVALMSQIYKTAHSVTAWLGAAREDSDLAIDFLVELYELRRVTPSILRAGSFLVNMTPRVRNALQKLFRRAYWSRLWIVQEVKLAREVVVRCGARQVLWEQILSTVVPLCEFEKYSLGASADVFVSLGSEIVSQATKALFMDYEGHGFYRQYGHEDAHHVAITDRLFGRREVWSEDGLLQLLSTIYGYCEFECADARDKVYGLLGLYAGDMCPVEIDYDQSAVDLYWKIVRIGVGAKLIDPKWLNSGVIKLYDLMSLWLYFYIRLSIHMKVDTPEVLRGTAETINAALETLQLPSGRIEDDENPRSIDEHPYSEDSYQPVDYSAALNAKLESLSARLRDFEAKRNGAASRDEIKLRTPSHCPEVQMPRFESNSYVGDDVGGFSKEPGALALRRLSFGCTDPSVRSGLDELYVFR